MARIIIEVTGQAADEIREWMKTHERLTVRSCGGSRLWHALSVEIETEVKNGQASATELQRQ